MSFTFTPLFVSCLCCVIAYGIGVGVVVRVVVLHVKSLPCRVSGGSIGSIQTQSSAPVLSLSVVVCTCVSLDLVLSNNGAFGVAIVDILGVIALLPSSSIPSSIPSSRVRMISDHCDPICLSNTRMITPLTLYVLLPDQAIFSHDFRFLSQINLASSLSLLC